MLQILITDSSPAKTACKVPILNISHFISNYAWHVHSLFRVTDAFCTLRGFPLQKGHTLVVSWFLATSLALDSTEKFRSAGQPNLVLHEC